MGTIYWLINILYHRRTLSFLTALFFITHPVHTEAVAYISGRAEPLSSLFILLCLLFYIKQISFKSNALYVLMLLSYILALLSKEYALITPVLLLLYCYAFKKRLLARSFISILVITFIYGDTQFRGPPTKENIRLIRQWLDDIEKT